MDYVDIGPEYSRYFQIMGVHIPAYGSYGGL